jgi:hypothetical protein
VGCGFVRGWPDGRGRPSNDHLLRGRKPKIMKSKTRKTSQEPPPVTAVNSSTVSTRLNAVYSLSGVASEGIVVDRRKSTGQRKSDYHSKNGNSDCKSIGPDHDFSSLGQGAEKPVNVSNGNIKAKVAAGS